MEKLNELIKKVLTKEVILYIVFGVLTTVVNLVVFYLLTSFTSLDENLSNIIAIITCVLFAYFTNRKFVFNSTASNFKERFQEFYKFMLGRALTMIIEALGFYLLFTIIGIQEMISKVLISVIVIILNFFISKFFAFKK